MNPAEFLADLISIDYGSTESVQSSQKRIEDLIEAFSNKSVVTEGNNLIAIPEDPELSAKLVRKTTVKKRHGWWRQFRLLFKRAWMQVHLNISVLWFQLNLFVCVNIFSSFVGI